MSLPDALSKARRIGFKFQTTGFGSYPTASTAFQTLIHRSASFTLNQDINISEDMVTSSRGLLPSEGRRFIDVTSGLPKIAFASTAEMESMYFYLTAFFQRFALVAETAPYRKTFRSVAKDTVPNFNAVVGGQFPLGANTNLSPYLFTIASDSIRQASGITPDGIMLYDAFLNTLNFNIDFNQRGFQRFASISGEFVGSSLVKGQNLTGTWLSPHRNATNLPDAYINNSQKAKVTIAGLPNLGTANDICTRTLAFAGNNNVTSDCKGVGGKANNYKIAPDYQFTIDLPYNSTTKKTIEDLGTQALVTLTVAQGVADTPNYFSMIAKCQLEEANASSDDMYQSLSLTFKVVNPNDNSEPIEIAICDNQNLTEFP